MQKNNFYPLLDNYYFIHSFKQPFSQYNKSPLTLIMNNENLSPT